VARRYAIGLLIAWGLFTVLFATSALPIEFRRHDSIGQALTRLVPVAMGLALFNALLLAAVAGPAILWFRARFNDLFPPWRAALVGAWIFPLYVFLLWFAFREHDETFLGLLRFWWRFPGELLLHAIPAALAGAAFGAWVGARPRTSVAG
jgi:hypothetical protein